MAFRKLLVCSLMGLALAFYVSGCSDDDSCSSQCGDGVCECNEETSCPQDCDLCGNGVIDTAAGEACDGQDFGGNTCLDVQCTGGILSCTNTCQISRATCTGCQPICGDSVVEGNEECDDGNTTGGDGCSATCEWENNCGDGVQEQGEECDCGTDPNNLPTGCTDVNGPDGECSSQCEINVPCTGGDVFDDCDPTDPEACCDDENCGLDYYCESSAFTTPLCMPACSATSECYYNSLCFTQFGMCYPALCGTHANSMIGGNTNATCQVPQGNSGWCVPLGLAKDDLGVCVESGTQDHGEECTDYEYIDLTKLCRDDPNTLVCDHGVCSNADFTCLDFCDPDEVYTSETDTCPSGYNCWNYSDIDDQDPEDGGCRGSDFGICMPDDVTDPTSGLTACDLTTGELTANRNQTCTDLNTAWECVLVSYQGGGISWGTRIGTCADTMGTPDKALWEACDSNSTCPPGSMCIEEDIFATNPTGTTRCIPYCDTENNTLCSDQHNQVPVDNVCTSVSYLFTGGPCTETNFSKLGLCACQSGGCGIGLCGNNVADGNETCDGSDLNGMTCQNQGCGGGCTLTCNSTCDGTSVTNC